MEWPKWETYRSFVDPALQILDELPHSSSVRLGLGFFKMFLWGLAYWEESQHDWRLLSVMNNVECKLRQEVEEFTAQCDCADDGDGITESKKLETKIHHLETRIRQYKPQVKEICTLLLDDAFRCKSCPQEEELFLEYARDTASFIKFVEENLKALSKIYPIDPVKQQIKVITRYLTVLRRRVDPVPRRINSVKNLGEHISQIRTWVNHLSCLAYLYWVDRMDEGVASTVGTMLSDFMLKSLPYIPGIILSYLEELDFPPAKDDIEILREGLIFLFSFMMDPSEEDSEDRERILGQIYSIIHELLRISETKLLDFLEKVAEVEVIVRKHYPVTSNSSKFNSPRTNAIGFLDSLLQKLEKWLEGEVNLIPYTHGIQIVWEELAWLGRFMKNITELKNEQQELKDLWTRIVDVVYHAVYVTNLCLAKSFSPSYAIICLQNVIEEIKLINNEARDIKDPQMYTNKMPSVDTESKDTLLPRATTSKVEGAFIGFEEDTRSIIDHLVAGGKHLKIISISGMPGQGKTTLAKRIYNDRKIQCHFHKTVWCYVSKECKIRDLMIGILHDVRKTDVEDISKLGIEDLGNNLRKSLKGMKYLVVMDDIWDDGVWCQVQSSFPDDGLGSRIIFTSRNHNLISENARNFISYPLRSFSEEESCDLMKEKLFDYNGLGPEFVEIGEEIAKSCKGLPLAVALAGSLLRKTEQKLELWNQVAKNLKSHLASEGCMDIIELSYKYLPDNLKSCFLYFGAFPRGKNIRAERLKLLWIAEGFINGKEIQCSEDLAEECLDYLVYQSLVVVAERSSMGGIKTCNVHDLLYDLCLGKIAEENFLHLVDKNTIFNESGSSPPKYGQHRLCIGGRDPFMEARPICRRKKLLTNPFQSLLWSDRFDIVSFDFLKSFKVLTVLDLEDVLIEGDVFPEVILCNIHLRYLALQEHIIVIPPSIADLWNLKTLILRGYLFEHFIRNTMSKIPNTMWKMKSLRHVRIDRSCLSLEDFEGKESYMAALDNMETLCGLFLGDDPRKTVQFLGRMTMLRKLNCVLERNALFSIFGSLENLKELKISCHGGFHLLDLETCSSSFQQNKNLRKLTLFGLKVASWSAMSTIEKQFPNLEVLKLNEVLCEEGRRWDLEDGEFSKLKYLKLSELYDLDEIIVSVDCDNPFPCLEILVVENCYNLEIPRSFGEISSLNTIKVSGCFHEASKSLKPILKQQRDLENHSFQIFVTDILSEDDDEEAEAIKVEEESSN